MSHGHLLLQDLDESSPVNLGIPLDLPQHTPELQESSQDLLHLVAIKSVTIRRSCGSVTAEILAVYAAIGADIFRRRGKIKMVFVTRSQRR